MNAVNWQGRARGALAVTWGSYVVLLLQQGMDSLVDGDPELILAIRLGVLLLFLPGMLRDNLRSFIWLCFVSLLYFTKLVERLFADPGDALSTAGMAAVVCLFTSAMLYVRWRARARREMAAPERAG